MKQILTILTLTLTLLLTACEQPPQEQETNTTKELHIEDASAMLPDGTIIDNEGGFIIYQGQKTFRTTEYIREGECISFVQKSNDAVLICGDFTVVKVGVK